jgi:carbon starvation protein
VTLWWGQTVAASPFWGAFFTLTKEKLAWIIIGYGFVASVLPVWLLLAPRDYLSAFLKIGVIVALAVGILWTLPPIQMPALTQFIGGSGPVFAGALFPFLFVTIACGAVSGFHSLISSGTTPKLILKESDARVIGYGSMIMESLVAIMALIAACILSPGVYFAINSPAILIGADVVAAAQTITNWGFVVTPEQLTSLADAIGEKTILSKTGGAPSLAIGMATIFTQLTGGLLIAFWYHFAILFEAVFILTAVDAGTRVGRFMVQDMLGNVIPKMKQIGWMPGNLIGSAIIAGCWGYFVLQGVVDPLGGIYTFWPLFGIANQMLAAIAFAVGTTILFKMGKQRYTWVTLVPMAWLATTTFIAGWQKLFHMNPKIGFLAHANSFKQTLADNMLPLGVKTIAAAEKMIVNDYVNTTVCASLMFITLVVILDSIRIWINIMRGQSYKLNEAPYVPSVYTPVAASGYFSVMKNQHQNPDSPRCC